MEKPRKKECSAHSKYNRQCYECKCQFVRNATIDAMSTWLEGEVPTVEEIELVINNQRIGDTELFMSDRISKGDRVFLAKAIHSLITRKIKGE